MPISPETMAKWVQAQHGASPLAKAIAMAIVEHCPGAVSGDLEENSRALESLAVASAGLILFAAQSGHAAGCGAIDDFMAMLIEAIDGIQALSFTKKGMEQ